MRRFADLFDTIDRTTSTSAKVAAMASYFRAAPASDAAWGLYFLSGRKLKRLVSSAAMGRWIREETGIPDWLIDESYSYVGDLAETIALLVRPSDEASAHDMGDVPLHVWLEDRLLPLRGVDVPLQREKVTAWWRTLPSREVFLLNKLLTGSMRVGVSQTLVERAIAEIAGVDQAVIAHRLAGSWEPTPTFFTSLISAAGASDAGVMVTDTRPYPFFLASPIDEQAGVEALGERGEFLAEWKLDGIRAQLIKRGDGVALWSRGDELISARFPEVVGPGASLPNGTVLDGEVLAMKDGRPLPFAVLQRRIGRLNPGKAMLKQAPAGFVVYDVLEFGGEDLREKPLSERRALLERIVAEMDSPRVLLSEKVDAPTWAALAELRQSSRDRNVEGLMLKRWDSTYAAGRRKGAWWKWKIEPYTVDAVLVYAQPGHGRRAGLLTDYTFAAWEGDELVPFAKAYSGLDQQEIDELDAWIRKHTTERFGPVRQVEPLQVFELGFEGIAKSTRHKAGIATRFPRMLRWRKDKPVREADTMATLRQLVEAANAAPVDEQPDEPTLFDT